MVVVRSREHKVPPDLILHHEGSRVVVVVVVVGQWFRWFGSGGGREGRGGAPVTVLDIKSNTPAPVVRTAKSQGTQSSPGPHPAPRGQPGGGSHGGCIRCSHFSVYFRLHGQWMLGNHIHLFNLHWHFLCLSCSLFLKLGTHFTPSQPLSFSSPLSYSS